MFIGVFIGYRIIFDFLLCSLRFTVLSKFPIDVKHFHVQEKVNMIKKETILSHTFPLPKVFARHDNFFYDSRPFLFLRNGLRSFSSGLILPELIF